MITHDFIAILGFGIEIEAIAILLLIYGIYVAITDRDTAFCVGMIACFLFLSGLSGLMFRVAYIEYQEEIPQNQVKILRQKISDAEKELREYLIDHQELNENESNAEK